MQVSDPWQRTRSLTRVGSLAAPDVFVDPIQSEIEVLGSKAKGLTPKTRELTPDTI